MIEDPYDHNVECKYCDEQAAHAADCKWLLELQLEFTELEAWAAQATARAEAQERELIAATQKIEALELLVKELLNAAKQAPQ